MPCAFCAADLRDHDDGRAVLSVERLEGFKHSCRLCGRGPGRLVASTRRVCDRARDADALSWPPETARQMLWRSTRPTSLIAIPRACGALPRAVREPQGSSTSSAPSAPASGFRLESERVPARHFERRPPDSLSLRRRDVDPGSSLIEAADQVISVVFPGPDAISARKCRLLN